MPILIHLHITSTSSQIVNLHALYILSWDAVMEVTWDPFRAPCTSVPDLIPITIFEGHERFRDIRVFHLVYNGNGICSKRCRKWYVTPLPLLRDHSSSPILSETYLSPNSHSIPSLQFILILTSHFHSHPTNILTSSHTILKLAELFSVYISGSLNNLGRVK